MLFIKKYINRVSNNTFLSVLLYFICFIIYIPELRSEGSGNWAHGVSGQSMLWYASNNSDGSDNGGFARRGFMLLPSTDNRTGSTYESMYNPDHRLYVYVKAGETVFWGFRAVQINNSSPSTLAFGNMRVYWYYDSSDTGFFPDAKTAGQGQTLAAYSYSTGGTTTYKEYDANGTGTVQGRPNNQGEAAIGPVQLAGNSGGYTAHFFTNTTGVDRAFWIEITDPSNSNRNFTNGFHLDFWDITVASGSPGNYVEQPGRVYSKFWSISNGRPTAASTSLDNISSGTANVSSFAPDFGFFIPVDNTFSSQVDDYFVKRIRVPGGTGGWTNFFANQNGPINTGTYLENRRSSSGTSSNLQYPLFLNDPDPNIWKTTAPPTASLSIDYREKVAPAIGGEAIVDLSISLPGVVDILVDLNENEIYDEGVDIILSYNFDNPGSYQIIWNGVDAAGNTLPLGSDINFIAAVIFFPVHFPIFDFEQSLGIRITNIRPGAVMDNLIYWDDSNLSTTGLTTGQTATTPRVNITGVLGPEHTWFATGDNGFGNNRTLNTWAASYYTEVKERGFFNFLTIQGNVFEDINALTDNQVNGNLATLSSASSPLYATLINTSTNLISRVVRVSPSGTYSLNKVGNGNYQVLLSTDSLALGSSPPVATLPVWWENTGENLGTAIGHDGTANGILSGITINGASLVNANFGIRPILSDPWVTKVVDNDLPEFGSQVIFTITASNNGYSTAQGVQVMESMPNGYSYLSHTVTGGTYNPTTKIWDIGSLPVGTTYTLRLRTRVEERTNGNYQNNVLIVSTTPDSNSQNNTDLAATSPFRLLPVTLISFLGKASEEHVLLEWATAREKDNKHFVLQRSRNGKDWQDLQEIKGQGTTAEVSTYQTTDGRPMLGDNFYRLRQVDFQGGGSVSEVIRIHFEPSWTITAYPNPFTDQIEIEANDLEDLNLGIFDVTGKKILVPTMDFSPTHLRLDFTKQPSGIYFIRLTNTQKVLTKKIVKGS